ncbi:MAG: SDR family NAD(P)-dependent oxidoreductase [Gemmatimonadota bacterium]
MRIRGRTAVVTGASRGIGQAIALNLARGGADVVLVARSENRLREVAGRVHELGRKAHLVPCDVTDQDAVAWAATRAVAAVGEVHILVNAAGIGTWKPFLEITPEEHDAMMATNYWGTFWWIRHLLPGMVERGTGAVVNISSGAGKFAFGVTSGYSASKFAVTGLSEALHREYRSRGVSVCCLHPGSVRTDFWDPASIQRSEIPPIVRFSPKISPATVARNVRLIVWTGMPVRTFPIFLALLVRINALWIRAGDLVLWKWFAPVLGVGLLLRVLL